MGYRSACRSQGVLFCLLMPYVCFAGENDDENLLMQPATEHAYIITKNSTITDIELARWMGKLFMHEGEIRVFGATFVFQECFGGGMLDNLRDTFGRGIRWVGGSASTHRQRAIGKLTQAEANARPADYKTPSQFIATTPRSTWSEVLVPEMVNGQTIIEAFKDANQSDIAGPHAVAPFIGLEIPQWSSGSGGEFIQLVDTDAEERHAVLWAGQGNRWRHYNNIVAMRDALISAWSSAGAAYSITIFYGFGTKGPDDTPLPAAWNAKPATNASLEVFLRTEMSLNMNEFTQFFFYATGHGGSSTKLPPPPAVLTPGTADEEEIPLSPAELDLMTREPENEPLVVVTYEDYTPTSGDATVTLNGVLLGTLPPTTEPGSTTATFVVDESLLVSVNTLIVANDSDVDLNLTESEFVTGGIDDDPPIGVADFDGDGDADLDDLATLQLCTTGPGINYWPDLPAGCMQTPNADHRIASDVDRDGDVDHDDFGVFQRCFSGQTFFTHPDCAF